MPRQDKSHDTPDQGEESLAEILDYFQASNNSKFGDINATQQRLDDRMLATDNHLFTTNAHQQATDKNIANLKLDMAKRFDDVTTRMEDSQATQATLTARNCRRCTTFQSPISLRDASHGFSVLSL
jgi:hypothetical protein